MSFKEDIKELKNRIKQGINVSEVIDNLFKIFEVNKIDDIDKEFKNKILSPFLKATILEFPNVKENFFKILEQRLEKEDLRVESEILETLVRGLNNNEFNLHFNGYYERLFTIINKIEKKYVFDLIWEKEFDFANVVGDGFSPFIREKIINSFVNGDFSQFENQFLLFSNFEPFVKEDLILQSKLMEIKISPVIIIDLIDSFKEDIFCQIGHHKGGLDVYSPLVLRIDKLGLKKNIFLPLFKKILTQEKQLKEKFFKEIESRLDNINSIAEIDFMEILLSTIDEDEFKSFFQDSFQRFYYILYKILNKEGGTDFWNSVYFLEPIGECLSPFLRESLVNAINNNDFDELIVLCRNFNWFEPLNKTDASYLINNPQFNLIEYFIKNADELNEKSSGSLFELGLIFSTKFFKYVSDEIKASIIKIIERKNIPEIDNLILLEIHERLEIKDLKILSIDAFKQLYRRLYKLTWDYSQYPPYRFNWFNELVIELMNPPKSKVQTIKDINTQVKEYRIPGGLIKEGKWEEFFDFEIPKIFLEREESHTLSYSIDYPSDQENNLPSSIFNISLYNPTAYYNHKALKAKLYLDKENKLKQLEKKNYLKFVEYIHDEENIIFAIGAEIKLLIYSNRNIRLEIKDPSEFSFQLIFSFFQEKLKENVPSMEKALLDLLRKDLVKINDYIALKLKNNMCRIYSFKKSFWTFIPEDIRRKDCIDVYELNMPYENWFKNMYIPQAEDEFQPKEYEFSDYCKIFEKWNDNNLQNLDFTWHFYSHLMYNLIEADYPNAKEIYEEEKKNRDIQYKNSLKQIERRKIMEERKWYEFFDYNIPESIIKEKADLFSFYKSFPYDKEQMISCSIIEIKTYNAKHPSDRLFKVKYYLERNNEMREIEYEEATYFKYGEFWGKRKTILNIIGEEIKLITCLDGSTSISFSNHNFFPQEVIFPDFKEKLKELLQKINNHIKKNKNERIQG